MTYLSEISATSSIRLLPSNEDQVKAFVDIVRREVEAKEVSALDLTIQIKYIEMAMSGIKREIRQASLDEYKKTPNPNNYNGHKIVPAEFGTRYDYSNDPIYNELSNKIKEREKFLRTIKEPITQVDPDTGEVITVMPAIKNSTKGLKITAND